tara:strand:- start:6685 stop:7230 length:546 start_codon:yes stop_codon:yes gene_type:complete
MGKLKFIFISTFIIIFLNYPVDAARNTDSYDGNIFPIYAGNGSIVPPQTNLDEALKNNRISILFFYLDDSSDSKALAPAISGLDLIWRNNIDIIALTTDEIQEREFNKNEAGYYWNGLIPQTLVLDGKGDIKYNKNGKINLQEINKIIAELSGIEFDDALFSIESFNEYNSTISKKDIKQN